MISVLSSVVSDVPGKYGGAGPDVITTSFNNLDRYLLKQLQVHVGTTYKQVTVRHTFNNLDVLTTHF